MDNLLNALIFITFIHCLYISGGSIKDRPDIRWLHNIIAQMTSKYLEKISNEFFWKKKMVIQFFHAQHILPSAIPLERIFR